MNKTEIFEKIANSLSNTLLDGEYNTFIDVNAEVPLDNNSKLVIWGEENDTNDMFFSVSVYDKNDEQQMFGEFSDSESMTDLKHTIMQVLDQYERMVPQPEVPAQEASISLWARVGVTLKVTPEELQSLQMGNKKSAQDLLVKLIQSDRCEMDGEAYFPEEVNDLTGEIAFNLSPQPLQRDAAEKAAEKMQKDIEFYRPSVAEQAFNLYDNGYITKQQLNFVNFHMDEIVQDYVVQAAYWENKNEKELPLSEDLNFMQSAIERMAQKCVMFEVRNELYAYRDENAECLTAAMRITDPLENLIRREAVKQHPDEKIKDIIGTFCDAVYNVKDSSLFLNARYGYLKEGNSSTFAGVLTIPLEGEKKKELIEKLETFCKKNSDKIALTM